MRWAQRFAHRRPPHLALACIVAGLAGAPLGPLPAVVAAGIPAVAAAPTLSGRAALGAVALGRGAATVGSMGLAAIARPARAAAPGTAIEADATILDSPRPTRFGRTATIAIESGPARGLRVYARAPTPAWPPAAGPGV